MATENLGWVLRERPRSDVDGNQLELTPLPIPTPGDDQLLVRNLYLSLDPTNRLWMSDRAQYLPPVNIGEVMRGSTLGIVERSNSPRFAPGDVVMPSAGGWQQYTLADAAKTSLVRRMPGVPLTAHLSVLGMTGMTAYFGLTDICQPREGETLAISAAAGAVGSVVGQIAKIKGCRVIGIAGSAEKCRWLRDDLGFDGAIDYKRENVGAALDALAPDGIDMLFENVGGEIMDASFARLRQNGRVAVCGLISGYNDEAALRGPTDFGRILMNRLTVKGFIVIDYLPRAREAMAELGNWIAQGQLRWKDHVVDGLENAPDALGLLFNGNHDGKLLVRIAAE